MLDFIKKNKSCSFFAVFNIGLFALLASAAPILSPDSNGYIEGSLLRGPGYPLLLALCRLLFGDLFLRGAVVLQTAIALCGVIWLSAELKKYFRLPAPVFLLAYLALVWPLLPLKGGFTGAQIMTEALAYGMLLCSVACLTRGLFEKDNRFFLIFLLLSSASVLVRPQFIFMAAAAAVLIVARFFNDRNRRNAALSLFVLLVSLAGCKVAERGYNYIRHGAFIASPGVGFVSAMNAFFLSDDDTALFFTDPAQRALFEQCYGRVKLAGMRAADFKGQGVTAYSQFYGDAADPLVWKVIVPALAPVCSAALTPDACIVKKEAAASAMGKVVLLHKRNALLTLMAYKVLARAPLDYCFLMAVLFVASAFLFLRSALPAAGLLWTVLLMHFFNYGVVGVLAPLRQRLLSPTEMLCAALFVVVAWQCYEKFSRKAEPETI